MLPRFEDGDHSGVLPDCWKVLGAEDHVEDPDEEGYRSLGKMLQSPFRNIVWARSLADLEAPVGFVNFVRVV